MHKSSRTNRPIVPLLRRSGALGFDACLRVEIPAGDGQNEHSEPRPCARSCSPSVAPSSTQLRRVRPKHGDRCRCCPMERSPRAGPMWVGADSLWTMAPSAPNVIRGALGCKTTTQTTWFGSKKSVSGLCQPPTRNSPGHTTASLPAPSVPAPRMARRIRNAFPADVAPPSTPPHDLNQSSRCAATNSSSARCG